MALTMKDNWAFVFFKEGFELPLISELGEIIEKLKYFYVSKKIYWAQQTSDISVEKAIYLLNLFCTASVM